MFALAQGAQDLALVTVAAVNRYGREGYLRSRGGIHYLVERAALQRGAGRRIAESVVGVGIALVVVIIFVGVEVEARVHPRLEIALSREGRAEGDVREDLVGTRLDGSARGVTLPNDPWSVLMRWSVSE